MNFQIIRFKVLLIQLVSKAMKAFSFLLPSVNLVEDKINSFDRIFILMQQPQIGLGDLIIYSPFFLKIKKKFPNKELYLVTTYTDLFSDFKSINIGSFFEMNHSRSFVICPVLNRLNYKVLLRSKYYLGYFLSLSLQSSFSYKPEIVKISTSEHYLERIKPLLKSLKISPESFEYPELKVGNVEEVSNINYPYICLMPFATHKSKQYPIKYVNNLIEILSKKFNIILIGKGQDNNLERLNTKKIKKNLINKTNISELVTIISHSVGFIGPDSGPSHIASVLGVKTLVICGGSTISNALPKSQSSKNTRVIDGSLACKHFPCYKGFAFTDCFNSDKHACLNSITPEYVADHFQKLILENS